MAIITCPECGQNPVSDRAPTCPRCGCPIAAGVATAPSQPSAESADRAQTILQERDAHLQSHFRTSLVTDSEFRGRSVFVNRSTNLDELVDYLQGWCDELIFMSGIRLSDIDAISRLATLKSLDVGGVVDDELLLRISKLENLQKLKFRLIDRNATSAGWLKLAKLRRLEFLGFPPMLLPFNQLLGYDWDKDRQIREELRRCLPGTIIE